MGTEKCLVVLATAFAILPQHMTAADEPPGIASAVNQFGLDLLRARNAEAAAGNAVFSPYSIEAALAMAWVGADGATRDEMARVLHLPRDENEAVQGFAELNRALEEVRVRSLKCAEFVQQSGGEWEALELNVANGLFVRKDRNLLAPFEATLRDSFCAPAQQLDFAQAPEASGRAINVWVSDHTNHRIENMLAPDSIGTDTSLVLVNAIHLRAPWKSTFDDATTGPEAFWVDGRRPTEVQTMQQRGTFGYRKSNGTTFVTLPYDRGDLQFVIILPDRRDGLDALEQKLTAAHLDDCATLREREIILHLPRFKIEPPSINLGEVLQQLGMHRAFNEPAGSADFSRIVAPDSGPPLAVSAVVHRAWISVDESGTEAAAATTVELVTLGVGPSKPPPPPPVVRVDHPFLFAIQHVASGTCLFLGRVTDPGS